MTDILPPAGWPNVRQLETNEFATGGANGNMNEQAKSLAARSELLKQYAALPYESKTGGYALNERVQLATGDIVRSTIASNVNNPNENMTGWGPSKTTKNTFILNPLNIAMMRSLDEKLNGELASVKDGGAIGDGTLHTLQEWIDSGKFSSLFAIQMVYPSATALTDSIDTVVTQTWIDTHKRTLIPFGKYFNNKPIVINGFGKEIYSECVSSYGEGDHNRTSFIHGFNGNVIEINTDGISPRGRHKIRGISFISDDNFSGNAITVASSQNHIPDCSFYNFKDGAIKITGKSYGTYINKCSFDRNGSNGKHDIVGDALVSATDYNTVTTITECIFETPYTGAISLKDSDPFYIGNNYIEPFGSTSVQPMIDVKNSTSGNTKGWIYRNYLGSINGNGFAIRAVGSNIHINNNMIADYINGVYLSSQNGSAVGNDIKGYSSIGIQVASVTSNVNNNLNVSGNVLLSKSTGATHGIIASNSTNGNLISSNIVRGKHDYYIRLLSCFNTLVASNSCLPLAGVDVSGFGIHEDDNCTGNSVRNNNVQATTKYRRYSFDYDEFVLANNSTPTTGVWLKGNIIKVPDTVAFGAIGYICTTAGTGVAALWAKYGVIQLSVTATYDPPPLTPGSQQSTTITLTGVNLGSFVVCSFSNILSGTRMWAEVTALNTVTIYHRNDTGSTVDLSSGTLTVKTI